MNDHALMTLLGIASIATAISGFSGIVAVFSGRSDGKWPPAERFRTTNMLILSLGACLLSFVPLIEEFFRVPDPMLWTVASAGLLVFSLLYFARTVIALRSPELRRPGVLVLWVRYVYFACLFAAIALQVCNVAGFGFARGAGPFMAGLAFTLIPAGLQFAFLVLTPLNAADRGA